MQSPNPTYHALYYVPGSIIVHDEGVGLYISAEVIRQPRKPPFITIDYENPTAGIISNTMEFRTDAKGFQFSVPRYQKGLIPYRQYLVTIKAWNKEDDQRPIEVISQKVRSYVDTRGASPKIFRGLSSR